MKMVIGTARVLLAFVGVYLGLLGLLAATAVVIGWWLG